MPLTVQRDVLGFYICSLINIELSLWTKHKTAAASPSVVNLLPREKN